MTQGAQGAQGAAGATGAAGADAGPAIGGGYPVRGPHTMLFKFDDSRTPGQTAANCRLQSGAVTKLDFWKPHTVNDLSGQFQTHNAYNEAGHLHCQYTGVYLVCLQVIFPAAAGGSRAIYVYENQGGSPERRLQQRAPSNGGSDPVQLSVAGLLSLNGPDEDWDTLHDAGYPQSFVEFYAYQDSGSPMDLTCTYPVAPRATMSFFRIPGHHAFEGDAAFAAWGDSFGYYA